MFSPLLAPRDLDLLIRERQGRLRASARPAATRSTSIRTRIGRALIAAGTVVGGERLEGVAPPPASPAGHHSRGSRSTGPAGASTV